MKRQTSNHNIRTVLAALMICFFLTGSDQMAVGADCTDKRVEDYQTTLLTMAFDIATSIPVQPHIKDRSKTQEAVVRACSELGLTKKGVEYAKQIGNWRIGICQAELAMQYAKNGCLEQAREQIEAAEFAAQSAEDWRKDRILAAVAKLRRRFPSISSHTGVAQVNLPDSYETEISSLDPMAADLELDGVRSAVEGYVELFERYYSDPLRRAEVEERIREAWSALPIFLRIETLLDLGEAALSQSDPGNALAFADEAQSIIEQHEWPLEHQIPLVARVIGLRARSGEVERGRVQAKALEDLFEKQGKQIVSIYRAETLIPLGGAYKSLGDQESAQRVYLRAAEELVENPNSRPRAEDLSALCAAMAVSGLEPGEELSNRIQKVQSGLSDPW